MLHMVVYVIKAYPPNGQFAKKGCEWCPFQHIPYFVCCLLFNALKMA
jgi:hypothetical protein